MSSVTPFQVNFHSEGAEGIWKKDKLISKGKADVPRLHFKRTGEDNTHYDIAIKSFSEVIPSDKAPKLSFFEKRRYALLRVKGKDQEGNKIDGWVKVNRSSVAKRFGLKRSEVKGDITKALRDEFKDLQIGHYKPAKGSKRRKEVTESQEEEAGGSGRKSPKGSKGSTTESSSSTTESASSEEKGSPKGKARDDFGKLFGNDEFGNVDLLKAHGPGELAEKLKGQRPRGGSLIEHGEEREAPEEKRRHRTGSLPEYTSRTAEASEEEEEEDLLKTRYGVDFEEKKLRESSDIGELDTGLASGIEEEGEAEELSPAEKYDKLRELSDPQEKYDLLLTYFDEDLAKRIRREVEGTPEKPKADAAERRNNFNMKVERFIWANKDAEKIVPNERGGINTQFINNIVKDDERPLSPYLRERDDNQWQIVNPMTGE